MKVIDNINERLIAYGLKKASDASVKVEAANRSEKKSGKSVSAEIKRSSTLFAPKSLKDWKDAIAIASDSDSPDFQFLDDLYHNLLLDAHTFSVIESRVLKVMRSNFKLVNEKGVENTDLKQILERPWFETFIRFAMLSKFTGVKVLELFETDEMLELTKVTSIPLAHLKPKHGIILKEPGDEKGWPYKEGGISKYYLQVGDDNQLGMLADLAPLILAKKFCSGSWLDFIEKFGIPFRYVNTDNMTTGRQDELLDMLINSISNHVAVIQGQETIQVADTMRTDPHKVFNEFLSYLNSEISKRVLGQDGTTDNKDASGTYGSLKVLQEVANDRHESDKLFIQYIINKQLLPRLLEISSYYAPLSGHIFDWDDSENVNDFIEKVTKLTTAGFMLDPAQIEQKTGLKILGVKNETETDPAKKKSLK